MFVDEMNMPVKEVYGAQPALELLRQVLDGGEMYEGASSVSITDTTVIAAMAPTAGTGISIPSRLLTRFNVIAFNEFTEETMATIFTSILKWHLKNKYVNLNNHLL